MFMDSFTHLSNTSEPLHGNGKQALGLTWSSALKLWSTQSGDKAGSKIHEPFAKEHLPFFPLSEEKVTVFSATQETYTCYAEGSAMKARLKAQ